MNLKKYRWTLTIPHTVWMHSDYWARIRGMDSRKSPLTARGLATGIAGLVVITASSMYVALRMGALPWPTVFVTVLSMAVLGKAKGSTLEEINCTHTLMSAGAMVAGGLAFTLPGLWMTDPEADLPAVSILAIAITGAVLGTIFTVIFRRTFIEKEKLPYPMGEAAYNTLIAGKEGKGAPVLFTSLGASALFTFIRDGLGKIPSVINIFSGSAFFPGLSVWVSPMALGIGAIIGPVLALMWFGGAVLGYFIITPAGLASGLFSSMAEADAFRSNLGIGLMIGTGLGVAVKAVLSLFRRKERESSPIPRGIIAAAALISIAAVIILALTTEITAAEGMLLVVGVYLTTYLSGMLTGQTGVNPMEVFAILVLLGISAVLSPSLGAAFSIAGVVAVACGLTGDVMNDLKSGSLIGTRPRFQIIAEGIGGIIGAAVASLALIVLKNSMGGFGSPELPAPQAAAVAAMAGGLENPAAFFIGAAAGLVLYLLRVPSATLGLGVYLPTYISSAMAAGAVIMAVAKKTMKDKAKADNEAALIASGLLGGEGITGVIIAIISMF